MRGYQSYLIVKERIETKGGRWHKKKASWATDPNLLTT